MKTIGIVTLNGNDNYGNKLQHYAVQEVFKRHGCEAKTIAFLYYTRIEYYIKHFIKFLTRRRYRHFLNFDAKIKYGDKVFYKGKYNINGKYDSKYDLFSVGSDQVWNSSIDTFRDFYLLSFVNDNNKKISFSASFGINEKPEKFAKTFSENLKKFKAISVREYRGKELVEELSNRKDVSVLIDPTMMLEKSEWEAIIKKPSNHNDSKYLLIYFLGNLNRDRKKEIERVASEKNYRIIDILNPNDHYYNCGPDEFLYLIRNASLICTDSFHACVFSVVFDKPFIVFDREQNGLKSINSRIETFISKFKLKNRTLKGNSITRENLEHDYSEAYKILEKEKEKANNFIEDALKQ